MKHYHVWVRCYSSKATNIEGRCPAHLPEALLADSLHVLELPLLRRRPRILPRAERLTLRVRAAAHPAVKAADLLAK